MDYTVVDNPGLIAKQSLIQSALNKDEIAYSAEFEFQEAFLVPALSVNDAQQLKQLKIIAAAKRREADAFIEASGIGLSRLIQSRLDFLNRLIHSQEHSHVAHSAELKVKESLGEPTTSYDSILETLDRGHALAIELKTKLEAIPTGD